MKNLIILLCLFFGTYLDIQAQPTKEILCGRDNCSYNFIPENFYDKIFYTSVDLGNDNHLDYVQVRTTDNQIPRSVRININSKNFDDRASLNIDFQSKSNEYNSPDAVVISDVLDELLINLNGFSPTGGKSASNICAEYVKSGMYGELAKLEFETSRILSQQQGGSLPSDRCVYSDIQNIQKRSFDVYQCGGDNSFINVTGSDPSVTVKRLKGKNKCLGVSFQDICLAPTVQVTCTWKLKYASTQSTVLDALVYSNDRNELNEILTPFVPSTITQMFSSWTKTDGGSYYHPNGSSPYGFSQAGYWTNQGSYLQSSVNSSNIIGLISSQKINNYKHEVTLFSSNTNNGESGLVLAFNRINNKNYYLVASRKGSGFNGNNNFALVFVDGSATREGSSSLNKEESVIIESRLVGSSNAGWGSRSSKLKAERVGDNIKIWASDWNSSTYDSNSLIEIDLNDYPELEIFKGKQSYGYFSLGLNLAQIKDISFVGGLYTERVIDAQDNKIYDYNFNTGLYQLNTSSTLSQLYGIERELINPLNGRRYWINQSGLLVDSVVGEYSSEPSETESKKFYMLEKEYLDKKEKGLLKYMCDNLTQNINTPYVQKLNLVNNSTFTYDTSFWIKEGFVDWSFEKVKIKSNIKYEDKIIRNGEVWEPQCNSVNNFNTLTVESGGKIDIQLGESCIMVLNVTNKIINNGLIRGKKNYYVSNFNYTSQFGELLTIKGVQNLGGAGSRGYDGWGRGGNGSLTAFGNGGGGGGGGASRRGCNNPDEGGHGSNPTKDQAGTGGYGGDGGGSSIAGPKGFKSNGDGNDGVYSEGYCSTSGGRGGSGGFRGSHGNNLYVYAPIFEGNGTWDFSGGAGGNGARGAPGYYGYGTQTPSGVELRTGSGGDGGGGAGGNGGNIFFRYDYVFSQNYIINVSGGNGGTSYTNIGQKGNDGISDIQMTGRQPDLALLTQIPNASQIIPTEVGKKYRVTGLFQQATEESTGSAGQINVYSDLSKNVLLKQYNIAPKDFINPAWVDSSPTYHHFGKVALGITSSIKTFRLTNKEEERSAVNCSKPFVGSDNSKTSTLKSIHFKVTSTNCSSLLEKGDDCDVSVVAIPDIEGTHTGYLKMICDDPDFGKKSTLLTEVQVTTTNTVSIKDPPLRNTYPLNPKPIILSDSGTSDDFYMYYKSCNDLMRNGGATSSGIYIIDPDGKNGIIEPFRVYCDMVNDGGGWTLVSKISNNTNVWRSDSPYWENDVLLNENDLNLDSNTHMKSRAYTTVSVKDVRLCMINTENCLNIEVNKNSAKELFSSTINLSSTAPSRSDILNLTQRNDGIFQPYCNAKGFNIRAGHNSWCRFGIIMNEQNHCNTPDSIAGFGCSEYQHGYHTSTGYKSYPPNDLRSVRGFIWVRDVVEINPIQSTTRLREPIDFVFDATTNSTVLELRAFQREYPAYYDNIKVTELELNAGSSTPPATDGLANVIGVNGPGYYDIFGEPEIERTTPTYDPEKFTTEDSSLWDMQYIKAGTQCPLYLDKIKQDYIATHVAFDPDDAQCDNIDYKYDPESKLITWQNVGFERRPEFGIENLTCTVGDCSVKSNIENYTASMSPNISLSNTGQGTEQGEGLIFLYDLHSIISSAIKGKNATTGVNDIPTLKETRYCYKIQDAATEGEESSFAIEPVVHYKQIEWQAIKVDSSVTTPTPVKDNGKKINLFKKIDSSVRHLLKEEMF